MDRQEQLTITGDRPAVEDFVARLTAAGGEWARDVAEEARLARFYCGGRSPGFRFLHVTPPTGADAHLRIDPRGAAEWDVTVVPVGRVNFPYSNAEAHALLAEFAARVADPARGAGIRLTGPGPRPVKLSEYTSPYAADLAEEFLTGAPSPPWTDADRKRWRAFALRSYRDEEVLDRDVLQTWLTERGVPAATAEELTNEYRNAVAVLDEYAATARS